MDEKTVGQTTLRLVRADITTLHVDAIVNAANAALSGGGGVDSAIHRAAGPELVRASRALAPIKTGEAVITPGFRLPARFVIHAVGPVWHGGERNEPQLLANAYTNSLQLAHDHALTSIAFPAISTGIYGYPIALAAPVALIAAATFLRAHPATTLTAIIFVCFNPRDLAAYQKALAALQ